MKARYLLLSLLASTALSVSAADATVLLTLGQTSSGDTVTGTRVGGTTTITSSTQVDITQIDATPPLLTPFTATFDLSATSIGQAINPVGPIDVFQRYSGSFSITNGATNYLSGTFSDAVFGSGGGLTLSASEGGGETVTFTSNVIAPNLVHGLDAAIALSLTDVTPDASIGGPVGSRSLNSFKSDVSGDFSNTAVPEPSTWAMMLLGFAGLAYAGYRRTSAPRMA
jgi:hypothetical protein